MSDNNGFFSKSGLSQALWEATEKGDFTALDRFVESLTPASAQVVARGFRIIEQTHSISGDDKLKERKAKTVNYLMAALAKKASIFAN